MALDRALRRDLDRGLRREALGRGGIPGFSGWMAAAVAVVAAAAGVVIGFFLVKGW